LFEKEMVVTLSRREFTKLMAAATVAAPFSQQAPTGRTIGIQVGAVSFLDEGVDPVLDRFQRDANVNALSIAAFSYGRGIAGRQVPGQPLPDHGKQEYDTAFHGGNFATMHATVLCAYFTETNSGTRPFGTVKNRICG